MTAGVVIIAHRGDSSKAPENTVCAFDKALQQSFCNFETDCQLTRDGVVIILHDEKLGKTTNGSGAVAEHTWEQLQQLDAGSWLDVAHAGARIPSLAEVLQRYRGKAHVHLELKSRQEQLPSAVAALVQQHGWDQNAAAQHQSTAAEALADADPSQHEQQQPLQRHIQHSFQVPGLTITSFHLEQLQASKQLLPQVPHGWLIQEVSQDIIDQAKASGFEMVCPRANALTPEGVQLLVKQGFVVRAWGVKTVELLHHVVACGAHGATVNWPAAAAKALGQTVHQQQQHF